jgi:hypothetical protein
MQRKEGEEEEKEEKEDEEGKKGSDLDPEEEEGEGPPDPDPSTTYLVGAAAVVLVSSGVQEPSRRGSEGAWVGAVARGEEGEGSMAR